MCSLVKCLKRSRTRLIEIIADLMLEYYSNTLLSSAAFLCVFGWTFWRIPTSSSTSTCLRSWTPRCPSSLRLSWTPAPRASTNSAGYVIGRGWNEEWHYTLLQVQMGGLMSFLSICVSRTLQVTNYSMQRRSLHIRRWWMSKSSQRRWSFNHKSRMF